MRAYARVFMIVYLIVAGTSLKLALAPVISNARTSGGVYQFLFNYPELAIIALESMKITKMEKLSKDYEVVLNEYFGKFKTIQELNEKFQNNKTEWNKRWNSFAEGYKKLKSTETIEKYFNEEKFIEEFQIKMNEFVKLNNQKLYKTG